MPKTNTELGLELAATLDKEGGWVLAERVPIDKAEVYSTVQELIECGTESSIMLQELQSSDDESVESIGHDADDFMATAEVRSYSRQVIKAPAQVPDLVYDLLSDPAVQRECMRALRNSPTFQQLVVGGAQAALPPPQTSLYLQPSMERELEASPQDGGENPILVALEAVASGLQHLGRAVGNFFDHMGTKLRAVLRGEKGGHKDSSRWASGIFTLAMAVLAIVVLRRARA